MQTGNILYGTDRQHPLHFGEGLENGDETSPPLSELCQIESLMQPWPSPWKDCEAMVGGLQGVQLEAHGVQSNAQLTALSC